MLKKIQIFGSALFVVAGLVFASAEALRPVAAAQTGHGCCIRAGDCAGGLVCGAIPDNVTCPVQNPQYTGYCGGTVKPNPTPIPIGGDN